jgi:hypothetical protein
MVLLSDMGLVEPPFGPLGDSVKLQHKIGAQFSPNVPWARKSLGTPDGTPR